MVAILGSPNLAQLLEHAEQEHDQPFWQRLMDLDLPVPIMVLCSLGGCRWAPLLQAEAGLGLLIPDAAGQADREK